MKWVWRHYGTCKFLSLPTNMIIGSMCMILFFLFFYGECFVGCFSIHVHVLFGYLMFLMNKFYISEYVSVKHS